MKERIDKKAFHACVEKLAHELSAARKVLILSAWADPEEGTGGLDPPEIIEISDS